MSKFKFTVDQTADCLEITAHSAEQLIRAAEAARSEQDVDRVFALVKRLIARDVGYATFDVEALWSAEDWDEILGLYLNLGDQYACTLCYDQRAHTFFTTDYESFADYLLATYGELHQ